MKLRLLPEIALDAHNAPGRVKGDPEKGEPVLQKYIFYHDIGEDEKNWQDRCLVSPVVTPVL